MIYQINNLKLNNFSKKFILISLDILIIIFSVFVSFSLRLDSIYPILDIDIKIYLIFTTIIIINFYLNNIYQILISYFDNQAILKIIRVILLSQIILFIINLFLYKIFFFPRSISIIAPIVAGILFILVRIVLNYLINIDQKKKGISNNILIYGINSNTFSLLNNLRNYPNYGKVIAFIGTKARYKKRELSGVKIFKDSDFDKIIQNYKITEIIITEKLFSKKKLNYLYNKYENKNIRIRNLNEIKNPSNFLERSLEVKPDFFDIIDRPKIKVDQKILKKKIKDKNILVTGGGGSIGSELCVQIIKQNPKKIYILEISELNLFNIVNKLKNLKIKNSTIVKSKLGDCNDLNFLKNSFFNEKIDEIYHAAAYKHVEYGEKNSYSMIKNNIFGTKTIINWAISKKVKNFVFISSDKAVNPKSILGYTKKYGEKLIKYYHNINKSKSKTNFTIVRFGNVIGSSGSVIPIFLDQVANKLPLTVTNKKVKRYFMSISEAVQLVINSSYLNKTGVKIYALDMGNQINIFQIAKRIIRLSGFTIKDRKNINGDIGIKIIGLKKGEKMSEELTLGKNLMNTAHPRIFECNEKINVKNISNDLNKIQILLKKNRFTKNFFKKNN